MEFLPYRTFIEKEQARAFAEILSQHQIPFESSEQSDSLDTSFGGNPFNKRFTLKLRKPDFAKVDEIMLAASEIDIQDVDRDHYLFSFTDEELLEVIQKQDEWNPFDFQLAQKILKQRGKEIPVAGLNILREKRIEELAKPEESSTFLVYIGYIFSLTGGLLGLLIGWHMITYRKTLPDGSQVFGYSKKDRTQGIILMYAGAIVFALFIILTINGAVKPF